ncbi:hypothetical protein BDR03DRAFT_936813 [Suillus americanus]|nr:hypothetical protein BDR03DRAFT_936813 [Suillus americanus]
MTLQTCPACGRDNFTVTGLSQHLAKSHDSRCQALYRNSCSQTNPNPVNEEHSSNSDNNPGEDIDDSFFEPEWEVPVQSLPDDGTLDDINLPEDGPFDNLNDGEAHNTNTHQDIEARAQGQRGCVVVPYPDPCAGQRTLCLSPDQAANAMYGAQLIDAENEENLYYPFASKIKWEIAHWAKLHGSSSTAFTDLLSIDRVRDFICCTSANKLNKLIDHELPTGRPKFKREQIIVAGESFDVYYHDIIECIKSLYGDPDFTQYLTFSLEWHYADDDKTVHLFHDMHTSKWWWETQKKLNAQHPGGTIVPIIISSNKTQVTMFRNKTAELHHKPSSGSHVLLAYLPTSRLEHITNKASRCCAIANLYHVCLHRVLAPLIPAGTEGISMCSGDGARRRCHPIFASFVSDYPEQLLTTGVKFGECPKCDVDAKDTGSNTTQFHLRKLIKVLDALAAFDDGNLAFVRACATAGIKPIIHPFWEDLPFVNIFRTIMPDVLHQLYQGLIKHLLAWLSAACGGAEIDACCRRLPPNHHICLFTKGITCLSCVSGTEHTQICRFILRIIIDIRLPNNLNAGHLLRAVCGLLDFLYLAQYPSHHYHLMITLFGTTDNYNTEYTERLHIDLAKDAYRATNHKDEFIQMTLWLERKEKILQHQKFVSWCLAGGHHFEPYYLCPPDMTFRREQVMTKHPTAKAVSIQKLVEDYGATHFREALAHYIVHKHRGDHSVLLRDRELDHLAGDIHFPFHRLPVFHKIKWCSIDTSGLTKGHVTLNSVHAKPRQKLGSRLIHRRSDTIFIRLDEDSVTNDLKGFSVGQVRVIFSLPPKSLQLLFPPTVNIPPHLVYIEWFTPFPSAPDRNNRLYKLSRLMRGGDRVSSIVPVGNIVCSIHLILNETVLKDCNVFWVNSYIDRHTFSIFR